MHSLVEYESVYLDTIDGKDIRYGLLTMKDPAHFWNTATHPWGTRIEEHRFNPPMIRALSDVFDKIESEISTISGLIITGEGRFFSNGIDTEYIKSHPEGAITIQKGVENLMARVLSLGVVTVALINGHATATGGILALCCDFQVMVDRGLFFLPAVKLGIVYSQGLVEVVKAKVNDERSRRSMLLWSKRYVANDLLALGIVEKLVKKDSGLEECLAIIRENHQLNHSSLSEVKKRLYKRAIKALRDDRVSDMHWSNLSDQQRSRI